MEKRKRTLTETENRILFSTPRFKSLESRISSKVFYTLQNINENKKKSEPREKFNSKTERNISENPLNSQFTLRDDPMPTFTLNSPEKNNDIIPLMINESDLNQLSFEKEKKVLKICEDKKPLGKTENFKYNLPLESDRNSDYFHLYQCYLDDNKTSRNLKNPSLKNINNNNNKNLNKTNVIFKKQSCSYQNIFGKNQQNNNNHNKINQNSDEQNFDKIKKNSLIPNEKKTYINKSKKKD